MRHDARVTQTRERAGTPQNPIPVDEAVAGGGRRVRTFESFSIVSFRWFFGSMFAGFAAIGVQMFLAGWLAFELTGSFAALGVLHLAGGISSLLASVTVVPVNAANHCPVSTLHSRSLLNVTGIRLSTIRTSWRVSWQSPSSSVQ